MSDDEAQHTDSAVSPVVGVILLVAVTVILSSVIGLFAFNLGENTTDSAVQTENININDNEPHRATLSNYGDDATTSNLALKVSAGGKSATIHPDKTIEGDLDVTTRGGFFQGDTWQSGEAASVVVLEPYDDDATVSVVDTDDQRVLRSTDIESVDADGTYNSCLEIQQAGDDSGNGDYSITPRGSDSSITAYCDFSPPEGDYVAPVYTLYYVEDGITTIERGDDNTCKQKGLTLFAPRSEAEYDVGRQYVNSTYDVFPHSRDKNGENGGLGPLGIYHPSAAAWDNDSENMPLTHEGMGTDGWESTAGSHWWGSERTDVTEPNGDYTSNHWLGYDYDDNGNVTWWNDLDDPDTYPYNQYLCIHENYREV